MPEDHIILPCYGNPLRKVWLPPTDDFDVLKIPRTALSKTAGELAADKARSLGLRRNPQVRAFSRESIGDVWVYVWVVWLKSGDELDGLRCMSVDKAVKHSRGRYGSMVRHLNWYLKSRH